MDTQLVAYRPIDGRRPVSSVPISFLSLRLFETDMCTILPCAAHEVQPSAASRARL